MSTRVRQPEGRRRRFPFSTSEATMASLPFFLIFCCIPTVYWDWPVAGDQLIGGNKRQTRRRRSADRRRRATRKQKRGARAETCADARPPKTKLESQSLALPSYRRDTVDGDVAATEFSRRGRPWHRVHGDWHRRPPATPPPPYLPPRLSSATCRSHFEASAIYRADPLQPRIGKRKTSANQSMFILLERFAAARFVPWPNTNQ